MTLVRAVQTIRMEAIIFVLVSLIATLTSAQQLDGMRHSVDYAGMSSACKSALNTTVTGCPFFLSDAAIDNLRLTPQESSELCTSECRSSLANVRDTISRDCTEPGDIIPFEGKIWPGQHHVYMHAFWHSSLTDVSNSHCGAIYLHLRLVM